MNIDLHIHTSASDGTFSPAEILQMAKVQHLGAIAITDHDTIEGVQKALDIGIPANLGFLTGVEISTRPPAGFGLSGSLHLLAYDIAMDHPELNRTLNRLQKSRRSRNPQIIEKLNALGIRITMTEIAAAAAGDQLGRPHIAQVLKKKKYVGSIDEAFDRYLGRGKPAYIDKYRIECKDAIALIRHAGGLAVLAHPGLINIPEKRAMEDLLLLLKSMDLGGLEVYYPEHSPEDTVFFVKLASHHDLLMTGGTDFHGDLKPDIRLGIGNGDMKIPYSIFETIMKRKWK